MKNSYNEKGMSRYAVLAILTIGLLAILTAFVFITDYTSKTKNQKTSHVDQTAIKAEPIKKTDNQGRPQIDTHVTVKKEPETSQHSPAVKKITQKAADSAHTPVGFVERRGVTFVEACIKPLDYELNERFWGWRPNDIVNVTDNINNFQLGVLEVTRRTAVALTEHISRSGKADAYVPSLEAAMNWFMIKATQYWFPSAESKYQEGLDELRVYIRMLKNGDADFYRRVDNLVPLLKAYESILGSCDENLVKNLGELSFLKADDIVYYTKGVASAMGTMLEAVAEDFNDTIESAQGLDVLHNAIISLHHASEMDPLIVLESGPNSLSANHRANMAAPISHARFYIGILNSALTGNI